MKLKDFDDSPQFIQSHFHEIGSFSQFISRKIERMHHKPIHVERIQNLTRMILLQPFTLPLENPQTVVSYLGAVRSLEKLKRHSGLETDSLTPVFDGVLKETTGIDFVQRRFRVIDNLLSFQRAGILERYWALRDVPEMSKTLSHYSLEHNDPQLITPCIIEQELKKWTWKEIEEQWPGSLQCFAKHTLGRLWLKKQILNQGITAWSLVKQFFPLDQSNDLHSPYKLFSMDQILLLDESERGAFLNGPHAKGWLIRHLKDVLQHEKRDTILPLFPIHLDQNTSIYEGLSVSGFSCFPEEELVLFLRTPLGRMRFENNMEFRQEENWELFAKAYPPDSMDNFHLYNRPEALLNFDERTLSTYLRSASGRTMAANDPSGFFSHERLQKALLDTYPLEEKQNLFIYFHCRTDDENLYLTLHSKVVELYPDELLCYWGEADSLRVRFLDNNGIDAGGLRRELVNVWFEAFMKNTQEMQFVHSPLGAYPRERNPGSPMNGELFTACYLGIFLSLVIRNEYLLGERFHPQWIACLHHMACMKKGTPIQSFLNQLDDPTLIAWVKEHVPSEDAFAAEQLQKIESLLKAEHFDEVISCIEYLNLLWESDELNRALETKNLLFAKQETRRLWLEGLHGYLTVTENIAGKIKDTLPPNLRDRGDWAFVTKEELAFSIQGRLDADWLKERFNFNGNDPEAVNLVKTTVEEWLELHRNDRIALKHLLLYLTGSAGLSGRVRFELVSQQDLVVAHTCSQLAHVKNGITREELMKELDLYSSGKLTGFTIS